MNAGTGTGRTARPRDVRDVVATDTTDIAITLDRSNIKLLNLSKIELD